MSSQETHIPGVPESDKPPRRLVQIAGSLNHPDITRVGLTTTTDGRWALMVRVNSGTQIPIREVEDASRGFPVVYQDEPDEPPIARPAYPGRGE
jgi:hypothetical protein